MTGDENNHISYQQDNWYSFFRDEKTAVNEYPKPLCPNYM